MRRARPVLTTLAIFSVLCVVRHAAGQAAPGVLRVQALNSAFSFPPAHLQIQSSRLAGDPAGVFTCCVTTKAGPQTAPDVEIGTYDQTKGTYRATSEAKALNTVRWEFGLSLEPGLGRYAILMRGDNRPLEYLFAARARPGIAFPPAVAISGVPANTFSMSFGYVGGQLQLFYTPAPYNAVLMQRLDISNLAAPKLTGPTTVVARARSANAITAVGAPLVGVDGDVEGLLIAEGIPQGSAELVFQAGLDPARPGSVVVPGCGTNCSTAWPSVAGGRLLFAAHVPNIAPRIHDVEVAWLLGDVEAPGGRVDLTGALARSPKAVTFVFLSGGVVPQMQLPAPFDVGHFALDLRSMFLLGVMSHDDAGQRASLSFNLPNDAKLRGLHAAIQGLSLHTGTQRLAWTNTAWLSVR